MLVTPKSVRKVDTSVAEAKLKSIAKKFALPISWTVVNAETTTRVKLSLVILPTSADCKLIVSVLASKPSIVTPPSIISITENSSELFVATTVLVSAVIRVSLKRVRLVLLKDSILPTIPSNSRIILTPSELPSEKTKTV